MTGLQEVCAVFIMLLYNATPLQLAASGIHIVLLVHLLVKEPRYIGVCGKLLYLYGAWVLNGSQDLQNHGILVALATGISLNSEE